MKIRIKNPILGVPITFLYKYNPTQFEIIGMSASAGYNKDIVGIPFIGEKDARCLINGKNVYARILIRKIRKQIHFGTEFDNIFSEVKLKKKK